MNTPSLMLGNQIWIEVDDTPQRIHSLFEKASQCGIGWVRIFLMWPYIESEPGQWNFEIYDEAFNAAEKFNIKMKATLTADSGPWHIGTPSVLHSNTGFLDPSQREPIRQYIQKCVERYVDHPALGQWILWNEPGASHERTEEMKRYWQGWLAKSYDNDLSALNQRWRTGFQGFDEIPFVEDIPHQVHQNYCWQSYRPWLDDWQARAAWLCHQIEWVRDIVREIDPSTETCINPNGLSSNQARSCSDLVEFGKVADCIGASYHPAWAFGFTHAEDYPGLIAALTRHKSTIPTISKVEITEVQTGNTAWSGATPACPSASELARYYLAGLASGAESVTGWCFNGRMQDFEAGDWSLLDENDEFSERTDVILKLNQVLGEIQKRQGQWQIPEWDCAVLVDPYSQAIEMVDGNTMPPREGRDLHTGIFGSLILTTMLHETGRSCAMIRPFSIPENGHGKTLVIAHQIAWAPELSTQLLNFISSGGHLIMDGASGRKDLDAAMHRPWPGGADFCHTIGLRATGLKSHCEDHPITLYGEKCGIMPLARSNVTFDANSGWSALNYLAFERDGSPVAYSRQLSKGKLTFLRGFMASAVRTDPQTRVAMRALFDHELIKQADLIRPIGKCQHQLALPLDTEQGRLTIILAPDLQSRQGIKLQLTGPAGQQFHDYWSGQEISFDPAGQTSLSAEDGVVILGQ